MITIIIIMIINVHNAVFDDEVLEDFRPVAV